MNWENDHDTILRCHTDVLQ